MGYDDRLAGRVLAMAFNRHSAGMSFDRGGPTAVVCGTSPAIALKIDPTCLNIGTTLLLNLCRGNEEAAVPHKWVGRGKLA
jgi:hypothetical protein